MKVCWFCGAEMLFGEKITRDMTCAQCKVALKACRNCRFFDPSAHNQCREPAAEWVRDKELANFCEFFEFAERVDRPRGNRPEDRKKKFDSLFKK